MLPDFAPGFSSAKLLPQPRRSNAMTRYPDCESPAICGSHVSLVPVFGCSSMTGSPAPPVSMNQSLTPGSSACAPACVLAALPCMIVALHVAGDRVRVAAHWYHLQRLVSHAPVLSDRVDADQVRAVRRAK